MENSTILNKNNITLINQHTENWGDEAAFLGFTSSMNSLGYKLGYVLTNTTRPTHQGYIFKSGAKVIPSRYKSIYDKLIAFLVFHIPSFFPLLYLSTNFRAIIRVISSSSAVCVAPGGENIGSYRDYFYVLLIQIALKLNKKVLFTGNSFGTSNNICFDQKVPKLLRKSTVLARERVSQAYLDSINVRSSLCSDNALYISKFYNEYLEAPLSEKLDSLLPKNSYTVFVPNCLWTWHPIYKNPKYEPILKNLIDSIFESLSAYGDIVILPQTYPYPNNTEDFTLYAERFNAYILSNLPSLEQIKIISNSLAIVGMRYHSIVFSALANTRCFSISYEKKILGFNKLFFSGNGLLDLTSDFVNITEFTLPPIQSFPLPNIDLLKEEVAILSNIHSSFFAK